MSAIAGVGTKFKRWSGTAWETIANVTSITGPSKSKETIDVTSLDSIGGYRDFIGSFRDGGTVQLSMNFTRSGYDMMNDDFESDDSGNYAIELPDADNTTFEFEGIVQELPLNITPDAAITCDVTIKVTGKVETYSGDVVSAPN